jgi:hypothetical protein
LYYIEHVTQEIPELNAVTKIIQGKLRSWTGNTIEEDMWLVPRYNTNAHQVEARKAVVCHVLNKAPSVGPYPFGQMPVSYAEKKKFQ